MQNLIKMSISQRMVTFENFMAKNFFESEYVDQFQSCLILNWNRINKSKFYNDIVLLPFENINLPAPAHYNEILTKDYGDYHKMVITRSHTNVYSVDISYIDYLKK